jgi:diguanylate cyclase (GGDEF)-like protein
MARRISGTLLHEGAETAAISVSIGTACFPGDGATADTLLAAADRSMYQAKRHPAAA